MQHRLLVTGCLLLMAGRLLSAQTASPDRPAPKAPALEFTDDPKFSVAGITDWTAIGGHGSDNILRTSEELARISARGAGPSSVPELRARAAVAGAAGHESEAHRLLGQADELAGDPLAAVREDAQAAGLDPSEANLLQWGSELLQHRAVLQGAQVFANGVRRYPDSVRLRTGLGSALFAEARYAEAQNELCRAAALDPGGAEAHRALAQVALQSPAVEGCVQPEVDRWRKQEPEDAQAMCLAGLLRAKKPDDRPAAVSLLRGAVERDPKLADAWLELGVLATEADHTEEAERDLRAAIAANPLLPEPHFRLALLLRASGRMEQAKGEFARHAQLQAEDLARVERERASVKEFVIAAGK